ncbi:kinase-like domain-containing protein [Haematococcus lacustris]
MRRGRPLRRGPRRGRDISSSVTKLRSSSDLSGLTSTMAMMSLKPDNEEYDGPPRTEVLLGDLLTWDAVTGQHQVTMRGVRPELHHPHFARGGSRVAYRAKWLTPLPRLAPDGSRPSDVELAPAGSQPQTCLMKPGHVVIAKEHRHRKDQHVYDAKCLETAKACAASFPGPPVTFIDCQLFRCMDNGHIRYLSVEEELVGQYCKHNGNNGYVEPRPDSPEAAATFELAQAFSHWSWVHSSGQYLVCDIQGVGGRWTDAQVNSQARVYGQADMGSQGITKFFESHPCHQACRNLRLSRFWPIED